MSDPNIPADYSLQQMQMQQLALQQQQLDLQRQQQQLQQQLEEQQQRLQQQENQDHSPEKAQKKEDADADTDKDGDPQKKDPDEAKKKKRHAMTIVAIVLLMCLVGGIIMYVHSRQYESTDDAFIDGHISQVAPQVSGPVIRLLVTDNERVWEGQVLFEIDPSDAEVKLKQAQAQALQAAAQIDTASANLEKSQADLRRYEQTDVRAVPRQQLDAAKAQADSDAAALEAAKANLAAAEANAADAALQLSYTKVKAPQGGRVTKRTVELGNYLTPGQAALAIVSDDLWVTANFKETQLNNMKAGQKVEIDVDAYPDATISGHIESIQSGSGSVFNALPSENATGNYVKIVQRVPVKIIIDKIDSESGILLAPGLSVEPRVTVR